MRLTPYLVVIATVVSCGALAASHHSVYQHGRVFSEDRIALKAGDVVTFVNDDTVPHNIYSRSAGNEFDLGSQSPGTATDVSFRNAGEVQVLCAIHPRMRMVVAVEE